jgi:hypothetical protein
LESNFWDLPFEPHRDIVEFTHSDTEFILKSIRISQNLTQLRLANFKKTYTNHYQPGLFDVSRDFCEISRNDTPARQLMYLLMEKIYPKALPVVTKLLHSCPYKVSYQVLYVHYRYVI